MIVGNIRKAIFIKGFSTTPEKYDLNKKSLPASEKLKSILKTLFIAEKKGSPRGVLSINIANISCKPRPQRTILFETAFRLFDIP